MLDIGWSELVVIGAVALVAIGPKDLPKVMRLMGQMAGKARRFMHEMQLQMEQMSYEAEVAENLKKQSAESEAATAEKPKERL